MNDFEILLFIFYIILNNNKFTQNKYFLLKDIFL
jgi:hypothetical protein